MRPCIVFAIGLLIGVCIQPSIAQNQNSGLVGLNHVGVNVPDMEEALAYYTGVLGFREAFRSVDEAGELRMAYLQISRNTFLELNRVEEGSTAGIGHLGLHVDNAAAAVAMFRQRGADVEDTRLGSTGSIISNITALDGIRVELTELPADSAPRRAMDSWQ